MAPPLPGVALCARNSRLDPAFLLAPDGRPRGRWMHDAGSRGDAYPWKGPQMGMDPNCLHIGQAVTVREINYGVQIHPAKGRRA